MKSLSDYIQNQQTKLFNDLGAFFAFSNKQFEEKQKEGVVYVSMDAGLICPKENVKQLVKRLSEIHKLGTKKDLKENGKRRIIERELFNHECLYTGDISDCIDALSGYGISDVEILDVFLEMSK